MATGQSRLYPFLFSHKCVGRRYLIVLGSIPNGAGPMVEWFCSFLNGHLPTFHVGC